jgi:uncharacterized protein YfaS (alpha-2-macroglobulin family)
MSLLRPLARLWAGVLGCTVLALTLALGARLVIPLWPRGEGPALRAASPPDGAAAVLPRSPVTLSFSAPMNRASAAAALRVDPPTPGSLAWSDDATALTFRPAAPLTPNITYTVSLDASALDRWWRPLARPAAVRFRTAPQPAVVAAMPAGPGVPADTSLAVIFSQPMVPPDAVGRPVAPPLQFTPAISPTARWIDQRTLLVRPGAPLAPATSYAASISAGLADLRGVELGAPYAWSFTTAWPSVVERAPAPGARWVSPRAPLTLRLDAPLDAALLRQALQITPPVDGDLAAATVGGTQVITFTPRGGWAFDTTYTVGLAAPPGSGLGPPPAAPWRFEVAPQPRLLAFFPGQGQALAPGQPVRLVFSTPQDAEALRAGISIEPPVADLPLSVGETEVRLTPELRPSTLYTITVAAGTPDRSGEPLAAPVQVQVRTAPARPALAAPGAFAGVLTLPLSRTAAVDLEATNLSALDLSVYRLDQPTLLLALDLGPQGLRQLRPERFGQPLVRAWRVPRSDPSDQPARLALPVGPADGAPLDPGAYYLRALSPEGPRADLLLLVTPARLTLRQGPGAAVVWATDAATGAPLPGLPVSLYRDGAPLASGVTGPDGAWAHALAAPASPLLAIAEAGGPAAVRADWRPPAPAPAALRLLAFPERAALAPGETARLAGLARRALPEGTLAPPGADTPCRLVLRSPAEVAVTTAAPCAVDAGSGALRGEITIPARLAPGRYTVAVEAGDATAAVPILVRPQPAARRPLDLTARPEGDALVATAAAGGLPLAGSVVSWTLRLDPLAPPPAPAGFTLAAPPAEPAQLSGQAVADGAGVFSVGPLPAGAALARRFVLQAEILDSPPLLAEATGIVPPDAAVAAVRLPSRLVPSDQRATVELLALDALGQPRPGARIGVTVARAGAAAGRPTLVRQARADDDGLAAVELVQLNPGRYEVAASVEGGPPTVAPLWVYGNRFSGWDPPDGQLAVVTDRDRYRPGDVATVLVAAPEPQASLLLTVERGGLLGAQARQLRAGQVITLPITADMAPGFSLGAVTAAGPALRAGSAAIAVDVAQAPAAVSLAADRADYLPSATATLTVTTADGAPIAGDLLLTLAPELGDAALYDPGPLLAPAPARPFAVATLPPLPARPAPAPAPVQPGPPGVALPYEGGPRAPGVAVARVALPEAEGRWRITAYVPDSSGAVLAATAVVSVSKPLALSFVSPPAIRPGDRAELALTLRNTSPATQSVRVALAASGLDLAPPAARPPLILPPGGAARVTWEARPQPGAAEATLRLSVAAPGGAQQLTRRLPVAADAQPSAPVATIVGSGPLAATLDLPAGARELRLALAPGLRAALAAQAAALAALDAPANDDRAALALIAAGLARAADAPERARWAELARTALAGLDEAQNADGGWGWWPDTPSDPFVTAFAVEAQAEARAALADRNPASLRAVAYLGRAAPAAGPDLAAYIAYAVARAGQGAAPAGPGAALAPANLAADGLAFLALAQPPAQAGPALDRLAALATSEQPAPGAPAVVRWAAEGYAGLPRGPAAVTAAATQALAARRPDDPQLPGAERALLAAWGVDGWASSYEAARVAAALLGRAAPATGGPRELLVAGDPVISGGPFTATVRAALPAAPLGPRPTLSVQASGAAPYLVAAGADAPAPAAAGLLAVAQELVDPATGAALDPAALRLGQVVGLRVTAVVPRPLLRADLQVALPGGLEPLPVAPRAPFVHTAGPDGGHRLSLGAAGLGPGVYTQTILARAVAPGRFTAPAARLVAAFEPGLVAAAPATAAVQITE